MRTQTLVVASLVAVFALFAALQSAKAQARPAANFQGEWDWTIYAKSRNELPPGYRNEKLKDVPRASIYLNLKQRGSKLTGHYSGSWRFLAKLEEGDLQTTIKGDTAKLELESGFGGQVTVLLTLRGNLLHWKMIKSEGEAYFPDDVLLHRVIKRKRRG